MLYQFCLIQPFLFIPQKLWDDHVDIMLKVSDESASDSTIFTLDVRHVDRPKIVRMDARRDLRKALLPSMTGRVLHYKGGPARQERRATQKASARHNGPA